MQPDDAQPLMTRAVPRWRLGNLAAPDDQADYFCAEKSGLPSHRLKSGCKRPATPMLNAFEIIRANPAAKRFEIGELVFAQFICPAHEEPIGIWSQTDHLVHLLTGKSTWTTASRTWSAEAGQSVFFKKGAYILPQHFEEDLCVFLFFIPDQR
jgi:hypothetical protein